jgi:hypothetical protein
MVKVVRSPNQIAENSNGECFLLIGYNLRDEGWKEGDMTMF